MYLKGNYDFFIWKLEWTLKLYEQIEENPIYKQIMFQSKYTIRKVIEIINFQVKKNQSFFSPNALTSFVIATIIRCGNSAQFVTAAYLQIWILPQNLKIKNRRSWQMDSNEHHFQSTKPKKKVLMSAQNTTKNNKQRTF